MVKSAFRTLDRELFIAGVPVPFTASSSHIDGKYGKRSQNDVRHVKVDLVLPGHVTVADPQFNSSLSAGLTKFNSETVQAIYGLYEEQIDKHVYSILNRASKRFAPIDLSFNIVNFFVELRELPSLADPFKAVARRADRLKTEAKKKRVRVKRTRKGRPNWRANKSQINEAVDDVAETFVNANFGFVPTISDFGEINSRFSDMKSNHQNLVERLRKKPRFRVRDNVELLPIITDGGKLGLDVTNITTNSKVTIKVDKCTLVVSGRVKYDCPDLYTLGPLLAALDTGGLRLSLSTIWNAVPFSWLVDWVVPIGDALSAMDKPWLDISMALSGTYSTKMEVTVVYEPNQPTFNGSLPVTSSVGYAKATLYNRFTLPPDLAAFRPPPMPSFREFWGPKKFGILAGIAKGFLGKF